MHTWQHAWTTLNVIIQKYCSDHISLSQKIHIFPSLICHMFCDVLQCFGTVIQIAFHVKVLLLSEIVNSISNRIVFSLSINSCAIFNWKRCVYTIQTSVCNNCNYIQLILPVIFQLESYWAQRIEVNKLRIHAITPFDRELNSILSTGNWMHASVIVQH